jgi:hypothetical protein
MSKVRIKRSLWEKLSFIERIDFYPYHKGLEISWSLVGDKTLSKPEEEKLDDDLGEFFYFNGSKGIESFYYPGVVFIGEGQKTASYSYREILEEGLDCNIGERILEKIFPDLDEGLKIDELFLDCHFSSGELDSCELSEYKESKLRPLQISKSILGKVRDEIREVIKEELGDEHLNVTLLEMEESSISNLEIEGEDEWEFEIVEDDDWEKNY